MYTVTIVVHLLVGFSLILVKKTETLNKERSPTREDTHSDIESMDGRCARQELYEYLAGGNQNYEEFAEFLKGVFALENLLYFVRVIMFRQRLLAIMKETNDTKNNEIKDRWCPEEQPWPTVFALNLDFVDGAQVKGIDKENIYEHALNIYNQFICEGTIHEINIPAQMRMDLEEFFNVNEHTIEEYLNVYNVSLMEIYYLLITIYNFKFQFRE